MSKKKGESEDSREIVVTPTDIGVKDLATVMNDETDKRALIKKFITKHMVKGVDFGSIRVAGRDSKPSLFKPGAEKFASLFKLRAEVNRDLETWEMLGSEPGTICYTCVLYTSQDKKVGEGKGAATIKEKGNANTAIKIAKKRAFVDAILSTGALSDFFTQDLEDMAQYDNSPVKDDAPVISIGADDHDILDSVAKQREVIYKLLRARGVNVNDAAACREEVATITQLALTEKNFPAIIRILAK